MRRMGQWATVMGAMVPVRVMALALVVALVMASASSALAETPPKGAFPRQVAMDGKWLDRNGVGLLEWGLFQIDLYWAGLYVEKTSRDPKTIASSKQRKRLKMVFCRSLTREQMCQAYEAAFEANAGARLKQYREGLKRWSAMMTAVKQHDVMTKDYRPGVGLTLRKNGKLLGKIKDEAFVRMLFQCYVGAKPPSQQLRRGLLGLDD